MTMFLLGVALGVLFAGPVAYHLWFNRNWRHITDQWQAIEREWRQIEEVTRG